MHTRDNPLYYARSASKITLLQLGEVVEAIAQLLVLARVEVDLGVARDGVLDQRLSTAEVMMELPLYDKSVWAIAPELT